MKCESSGFWICDEGDIGQIEHYGGQFGPGTWPDSGRYTSINGEVLPTFLDARAGVAERWRVIHAGVRDTVNLVFRKRSPGAPEYQGRGAEDAARYIEEHCPGDPLTYHLVAADGLTMANAVPTQNVTLQPGYRWDAMVIFPEGGEYCIIDTAAPAGANVDQAAPSRQLMGFVNVDPIRQTPGFSPDLKTQLIVAAKETMPADVMDLVVADLEDNLLLTKFVPHQSLLHAKHDFGEQTLTFNIDVSQNPPVFEVDGKPYDPGRVDRVLEFGGYDEWTLDSDLASHPFHIHVNPFQVVEVLNPEGKDISGPRGEDYDGDTQYVGMKGVWKDTIWVKNNAEDGDPKTGKYTIKIRTHYRRYIGEFVLHCHILDHEDQGMMQNVTVALPNGFGGVSSGAHGHH